MNSNNLAIIVAFYLSKYNKKAISDLGFKTESEAFTKIGEVLGVKKNYIKFRRDEFDPINPWRRGWQRKMDYRIIKSIEALQNLEESELRIIVRNILADNSYWNSEDIIQITNLFSEEVSEQKNIGTYIIRSPTGKAAEEYFIDYFLKYKKPFDGSLTDCRDFGVGYDFRIESEGRKCFVEVKGLSKISGGILFTSKEWSVAKSEADNYYVCVISNILDLPQIIFIQNPAKKLEPKQNICTTIQISYGVTQKQLDELK